jgi:hypothetical protein
MKIGTSAANKANLSLNFVSGASQALNGLANRRLSGDYRLNGRKSQAELHKF